MRILNDDSNEKLNNVSFFLTKQEAIQLHSDLQALIADPSKQHTHISSDDYQKEITVCIYDEKDLSGLHERVKNLILEDK
ncbi:MAG: hypothetical protein KFB93_01435 [Simkaniaceae bacterium]|nr:MAG: hypothetical protein KFB93_01435 [Simkaniaceae bacterium]